MTPHRHQLARLDRALLALVAERCRLVREAGGGLTANLDDVLRRAPSDLSPDAVQEFFKVLDAACGAALNGRGTAPASEVSR